jgi:hypothetical protein
VADGAGRPAAADLGVDAGLHMRTR